MPRSVSALRGDHDFVPPAASKTNRVVEAILTHFSDVLEGEIGVVDVLLDFGHESVRNVVLVESLDLQQEKTCTMGVKVGWRN